MDNTFSKYKKILNFLILIVGFFFLYNTTNAAVVSLVSDKKVTVGQRVTLDILVDPENVNINSVEATINFSSNLLDFNGFSVKQSSIPIWVETPKETRKGSVHFSGVIPGGLERIYDPVNTKNRSIPIVRLFFIAKAAGENKFSISDSQVLRNDGKGTQESVSTISTSISVIENSGQVDTSALAQDTTPPLPFQITLVERSVFGRTPKLAIFVAEDSEGGISKYEVAIGNLGFHIASSPTSLPYRLFPYSLTVRAYDFSGNVREQQVTVPGESPYGLGILIVLLILALWLLRNHIRKRLTS